MKKELKKIGAFLKAWGNMTITSLAIFALFLWIPWHAMNALAEYFFGEGGLFPLVPGSWLSLCVVILAHLAFFFGVWLAFSLILYGWSVLTLHNGKSEPPDASGRKAEESRESETKP